MQNPTDRNGVVIKAEQVPGSLPQPLLRASRHHACPVVFAARGTDLRSMQAFVARALLVAGIVVLLWFAAMAAKVILIAFAAVLLATLIRAISTPLTTMASLPDKLAVVVVAIALACVLILGIWFAGGLVVAQAEALWARLPAAVERIRALLQETDWGKWLAEGLGGIESRMAIGPLTTLATVTAGAVVDIFLVVATGIYLALDPGPYVRGTLMLVPAKHHTRIAATLAETGRALRHWLLGHVIGMVSMAVLTGVGLWLLGIPYALALGLVAGLLEFIPILGPILAALPAILAAVAQSPNLAVTVIVFYVLVQQVESYLIIPMAQRWAVSLPPALCLLALAAMGTAFGFLGVVLATPLVVAAIAVVRSLKGAAPCRPMVMKP